MYELKLLDTEVMYTIEGEHIFVKVVPSNFKRTIREILPNRDYILIGE